MAALLSSREALRRLHLGLPACAANMFAFYSSHIGGIVTDPAMMVVPLDDHAFHRGHAVFDTCNVCDGEAFGLDFHLDRLIRSATKAKIDLGQWNKDKFLQVILSTIAAGGQKEGVFVRYWLSAGRGDFYVSSKNCIDTSFFVVVHGPMAGSGRYPAPPKSELKERGVKEYVVSVPQKPALLANVKSNNYMLNALCCMESEQKGGHLGIQVDSQGKVGEGAIGNVAIVDQKGVLRTPPFDKILAGTTVERIRALQMDLVTRGIIKGVEFSELTVADLKGAREAFSLAGGFVLPIVEIDDVKIGNGQVGRVFSEIDTLLLKDMQTTHRHPIPWDKFTPRQGSAMLERCMGLGQWAAGSAMVLGLLVVGGWVTGSKPLSALARALDA